MKTLDEVIKAYELCHASVLSCEGCPYDNGERWRDSDCYLTDALHYLKVFRDAKDALDTERDRYAEAVKNCEVAENKYKRLCKELRKTSPELRNDPLDWEMLKQMEGKPVWVEADDGKYKGWVMVGKFYSLFEEEDLDAHVNLYYFGRSMEYSKEMYGYYWQAYRKERS